MLYLDSSALVKRYVLERGTEAVAARFETGERVFTSALSFAEVHAALGRKHRLKHWRRREFAAAGEKFVYDSTFSLVVLELNTNTMAALPDLVERYSLRGSDAAHLSAAVWLRDMCLFAPGFAGGDMRLEFGVADRRLGRVAARCGLTVFNPEGAE